MPAVHPVEGADGDRARAALELLRQAGDPRRHHPAASKASTCARTVSGTRSSATCGSRASAAASGNIRSRSASSTANGPTAVRRRLVQCPPSAAAIARHVGARADVQLEPRRAVGVAAKLERVDRGAAQRHRQLDAAPREPVGTLTVDLHRGGGRDRQLDLAAEARERPLELGAARRRVLLGEFALRVAGRARAREVDIGEVALVEPDEAGGEPGREA